MSTPTEERDEPREDDNPRPGVPLVSPGLFAIFALTVLGLLVVVIVVGLARRQLDATGVATVLSTVFSGIVVGALVNTRGKGGGSP